MNIGTPRNPAYFNTELVEYVQHARNCTTCSTMKKIEDLCQAGKDLRDAYIKSKPKDTK